MSPNPTGAGGRRRRRVRNVQIVGVHLVQTLAHLDTPRRSIVARVNGERQLLGLDEVGDDRELLDALTGEPAMIVVDAPLAIPNREGSRDLERVLAWCDINLFPASIRRVSTLHGGLRGVGLAAQLDARAREGAWEAAPDQVLRQVMWEQEHPAELPPMDLADYRARWPLVRAPVYRPKAAGRARAEGLDPAWRLVGSVIDLAGWMPASRPDDWRAIADAGRLDALCCAIAGLRAQGIGGRALRIGTRERGRIVVPVCANLAERLQITLDRMRADHHIAI